MATISAPTIAPITGAVPAISPMTSNAAIAPMSVASNQSTAPSVLVNAPTVQNPNPVQPSGATGGINDLSSFYSSIGQSLPSVASRASLYSTAGGTDAYTGTAAQNAMLLKTLQTPTGSTGTAATTTGSTTTTGTGGSSTTGTSTTDDPFIASSDPTTDAESSLTSQVTNAINGGDNNTALTAAHDQAVQALTDYQTTLDEQRQAAIDDINKQYDNTEQQTESDQKSETGTTAAGLLRMGGYLGESGSGTGVLNTLAAKHTLEISTLEAQRQSALNSAKSAIDDKQFATAQSLATEAKSYEQEINDRKNTFFNQVLQATSANQTTASDTLTKLSALSSTDLANVPQSTLDSIDSVYGSPGFASAYLKATTAASAAKASQDQTAATSAYIDMLQKLPTGQVVTLPNGSTLTGLGKTSDIETFNEEDKNGNVTIVSLNKGNGQITEYGAGQIGKADTGTTGTPDTTTQQQIASAMNALPKDSSTNFITDQKDGTGAVTKSAVNAYNAMYQQAVQAGAGKWFLDNYPAANWIGGQAAAAFKTE